MHFFSCCCLGHVLLVYLIIRNAPPARLLFYPAACFSLVFNLPVVTARKTLTGFFEFLGWPFCTRVRRFRTQSAAVWLVFLNYEHANLDPVIICFNVMVLYLIFVRGLPGENKCERYSVWQDTHRKNMCLNSARQHTMFALFFCPSDEDFDNWLSNYAGITLKWCINICRRVWLTTCFRVCWLWALARG